MGEDSAPETLKTYYSSAVTDTDRANKVSGQLTTEGTARVLCVNGGPGYDPQGYVGTLLVAPQGTIAWAKTLADGASLTSPLQGKVVSRTFPSGGYFYIQEADRSMGIRVNDENAALTVTPGDTVTIASGSLTTADGERVINTWGTTIGVPVNAPRPAGLITRNLGGGDFNVYSPGPGGAYGLNNVGLLVRIWGKVTAVGSDAFYVDDGSATDAGSGFVGVRVEGPVLYPLEAGDYATVQGISSLFFTGTDYVRSLRVAKPSDIGAMSGIPPSQLVAYSTGSGKIMLFWQGVEYAAGYNVYRSLTP
jgi:hypothetical protein